MAFRADEENQSRVVSGGMERGREKVLSGDALADNVKSDIEEGMQLGLRGVPFFVFNRKIGVAGAQDTEIFLQALNEANKT